MVNLPAILKFDPKSMPNPTFTCKYLSEMSKNNAFH